MADTWSQGSKFKPCIGFCARSGVDSLPLHHPPPIHTRSCPSQRKGRNHPSAWPKLIFSSSIRFKGTTTTSLTKLLSLAYIPGPNTIDRSLCAGPDLSTLSVCSHLILVRNLSDRTSTILWLRTLKFRKVNEVPKVTQLVCLSLGPSNATIVLSTTILLWHQCVLLPPYPAMPSTIQTALRFKRIKPTFHGALGSQSILPLLRFLVVTTAPRWQHNPP